MNTATNMAGRTLNYVSISGTWREPADCYSISFEEKGGIFHPVHITEHRRGLEWSPRVVGWAATYGVLSKEDKARWRTIINSYREPPVELPSGLDEEFVALMKSSLRVSLPPLTTNLLRGRATLELRAPTGRSFVTREIFSRRRIIGIGYGPKPS